MAYATIAQLRGHLPQVPEYGQQRVTLSGATGGTFTLVYEGAATAALVYNATATAVQTALRAVTAIGASGVKVTGRPGGPYLVEFQGTLATDAAPLSSSSSLTGSSPTITIAPATDALLQAELDRATGIVRSAIRAQLPDPAFDFAAYGAAATKIVIAPSGLYLRLPPYQAGSVTLVEYPTGYNPASYGTLPDQWIEEDGRLFRAAGWVPGERYRVTAVWGYGATVPDQIVELVLELAVNIWRSRDKGGFTEVVGAEGGGSVRMIAGLNKQQQLVLESLASELWDVAI